MKRDESINRHVNIYITDFFKVFGKFRICSISR